MLRRPIEQNPLKPFVFPSGFVLIQDTREQLPLFDGSDIPEGLVIESQSLRDGDYSVLGLTHMVAFERKRISDFFSYIGRDRERTTRKMERFREIVDRGGFVGLVVEASEGDLLNGYHMSSVPPETVRQTLVSFEVRYGVHCYYSRDRKDVCRWVLDRAIKAYRMWHENIQEEFKSLQSLKLKHKK